MPVFSRSMSTLLLFVSANAINELTNNKPGSKALESHCSTFLKSVEAIESELSEQISYLSQVTTSTSSMWQYYIFIVSII